MHIHTVNLRGKQSRFIAARSCPDFHNDILVIIGVFRQKQNLQLIFQLFNALSGCGKFFLKHIPHILIGLLLQHRQRILHILFTFFILFIRLHQRGKVALFFHQLTEMLLVIRDPRLRQFIHDLLKPPQQIIQSVKHIFPLSILYQYYLFQYHVPNTTRSSPEKSFKTSTSRKPCSLIIRLTASPCPQPIS